MKTRTKLLLVAALLVLVTVVALAQSGSLVVFFKGADIASAATISVRGGNYFHITGTANIDSIVPGPVGKIVVLTHNAADTVLDGKNLKLAGNFNATAFDALVLISDGTNWIEVDRSAN